MKPAPPSPALEFASWIVWEDEWLVAVDKPAGVLSQGGEGGAGRNLVDLARAHYGLPAMGVLHRIDRNVSGVVLLAKDPRAARGLSEMMGTDAIERVYVAVVLGSPEREAFDIDASLVKDARVNEVTAFADPSAAPPGLRELLKLARTSVAVTRRFRAPIGECAVLDVRPRTGRSHQIRAHLKFARLPILGDPKYGVAVDGLRRPLLHAGRVGFTHPMTQQAVECVASVPWADGTLVKMRALRLRRR